MNPHRARPGAKSIALLAVLVLSVATAPAPVSADSCDEVNTNTHGDPCDGERSALGAVWYCVKTSGNSPSVTHYVPSMTLAIDYSPDPCGTGGTLRVTGTAPLGEEVQAQVDVYDYAGTRTRWFGEHGGVSVFERYFPDARTVHASIRDGGISDRYLELITCVAHNCCLPGQTSCNDGVFCTDDICDVATAQCSSVLNQAKPCASDGNPCTYDNCTGGACYNNRPNGTSCSDGNNCTTGEQCSGGVCSGGSPVTCNDGNVCTSNTCTPAVGCQYPSVPNGTPCSDGNVCNGAETCQGGVCTAGTPLSCDDSTVCTLDSCSPALGCAHAPIVCDDEDPCTDDVCDPALGCQHPFSARCLQPILGLLLAQKCGDGALDAGEQCDDGNATDGDCCSSACRFETAGAPCTDGSVCTLGDNCDGAGGCVWTSCDVGRGCGQLCGVALACQEPTPGVCRCAAP
jgi:cysteine-rich repeat protein